MLVQFLIEELLESITSAIHPDPPTKHISSNIKFEEPPYIPTTLSSGIRSKERASDTATDTTSLTITSGPEDISDLATLLDTPEEPPTFLSTFPYEIFL